MRKLMLFAIGFAAACAAVAYLAYGVFVVLGAVVAMGLCMLLRRFQDYRRKIFCVFLGCAVGLAWFLSYYALVLRPVQEQDGQTVFLNICVTDYSRTGEYGVIAEGETEVAGGTYSVQFYVNEDITLSPGDRVTGEFSLRFTGLGGEKPTYHQGDGVFLLCYPEDELTVSYTASANSSNFVPDLRKSLLSLMDKMFPADTASFAKALLLGEREDLPFETEWALKTSGTYHIVAVSGMHVSVLFTLLVFLCAQKRALIAIIGYPLLFLFAAVAGFSPSIVRATIMQSLMILGLLVDREYDPPTALGTAVLLILAQNPLAITSVSFQLSVGCMIGMLLFSPKIHRYLLYKTKLGSVKGKSLKSKLRRWFAASVSATLGAISVTTILSAIYFGNVCLVGILSNFLTLWLVSAIFIGVVFTCLLGALWLPLGVGLSWLLSWPIRFVLWIVNLLASIPFASVYTCSVYVVLWLVLLYALLIVFIVGKKKRPAVFGLCVGTGLLVAVALSCIEPRLDDYRVTAVDVGQGQCLILQNNGKTYVVDCGSEDGDSAAIRAGQLLHSQGVFRVDGLILTHYDDDHTGGAEQLLRIVPADKVYMPTQDRESDICRSLTEKYAANIHWMTADLRLDAANITIFASPGVEDSNESGLCILFQPKNCDILITGDRSYVGEKELLTHTALPDLEILVAGHHGARSSTSWELLQATCPETVLISVGAGNRYKHPSQDTLIRLERLNCKIRRTDMEGTIILRG